MKKLTAIFIILILVVTACSSKATTSRDTEVPGAESDNDSKYYSLVARVKRQSRNVNYTDLRLAYAKTSFYNPYETDFVLIKSMREAYSQNEYKEVIHYAEQLLEKNFIDIDARMACAMAYEEIGDSIKYNFHKSIATGLIESILESGDGKSPETAFKVVMIKEEYAILDMFGYKLQQQALAQHDGSSFDIMDVINEETEETATLYFNIDLPMSWYGKMMK